MRVNLKVESVVVLLGTLYSWYINVKMENSLLLYWCNVDVGCCNENVTRKMFPLLPAGGGSGVNSANTHFLTREESR